MYYTTIASHLKLTLQKRKKQVVFCWPMLLAKMSLAFANGSQTGPGLCSLGSHYFGGVQGLACTYQKVLQQPPGIVQGPAPVPAMLQKITIITVQFCISYLQHGELHLLVNAGKPPKGTPQTWHDPRDCIALFCLLQTFIAGLELQESLITTGLCLMDKRRKQVQ